MRIIHNSGSVTVKGRSINEDFSLTVSNVTDIIGGTTIQSTIKDAVFDVFSGSQVTTVPKVNAAFAINIKNNGLVFESLTPSVATIDQDGLTQYVSNGNAKIQVTATGVGKKIITALVNRAVSASSQTFLSWSNGSLVKHIVDAVATITGGLTANYNNGTMNRFTTNNGIDQFVRNNSHVLASVDLTGFAASLSWVGWSGGNRATAISAQHVIGANHWFPPLNRDIVFVAADNTMVVRQITASQRVGTTDIRIGLLDSPLPASITPLKILPANATGYLPNISYGIPVFYDFNPGIIHIQNWINTAADAYGTGATKEAQFVRHSVDPYKSWYLHSGGSGSPCFTIINNEAVLLCCFHYEIGSLTYGAPFVSNYINEINSVMTSLLGAPTYSLQTVTLSGFPTY